MDIQIRPWPPFKRSGTTITQRTSGDNLNSTGNVNLITGKKLTINDLSWLEKANTNNQFIGVETSPAGLVSADSNLGIGIGAGISLTTGDYNIICGINAGDAITTASSNTIFGYNAGTAIVSASDNTLIGFRAGQVLNDSDVNNTLVGSGAGQALGSSGDSYNNVLIGYNAGVNPVTMNNTVMIGHQAGSSATNPGGCVFIGYQAGQNSSVANRLFIDNSNSASPLIYGEFANNLLGFNGRVGIGLQTKLSTFTVQQPIDIAGITGTTTVNASTTITGVTTIFLSELGIGDRISLSSAAATYATITAIASDTSLTVDTALGDGTSQSINKKASIVRFDDLSGNIKYILKDTGVHTFNSTLHIGADDVKVLLGTGSDGEIYVSSDDLYIRNITSDKDIIFSGNDGGAQTTIMSLDVSAGQLSGMQKAVAGVMTNASAGTDYTSSSSTETMTNKRITPRITTIVSNANPTINTDNCDAVTITAQAGDIASMTTNLTGTPNNFDKLIVRIKDNATARAITWGASFEAKGVALPTTTVISKALTVGFIYDTVTAKWGCVASAQEA